MLTFLISIPATGIVIVGGISLYGFILNYRTIKKISPALVYGPLIIGGSIISVWALTYTGMRLLNSSK